MYKQTTFAILLLILLFIFIPAGDVFAQAPEFTGPIVPCGGTGMDPLTASGQPTCGACELVTLSQNVINFIIFFATVVAVLSFVYAGFIYITAGGDTGKVTKAHQIFWSVFVGFIIVLSAWLFISFLLSSFLRTSFQPWEGILCEPTGLIGTESEGTGFSGDDTGTVGVAPPPDGTPDDTTAILTHAEAEARLAAAGITVFSSGGCSDPARSECTSFEGIRRSTIDEVIALKEVCGCPIVVTGGTETGHADGELAHSTGYKIDIDKETDDKDAVTKYIKGDDSGFESFGDSYASPTGMRYVDEGSHWDILVTGIN